MSNAPRVPDFLKRKLDKTGQTRGADDDEIFQNRVKRNSTCLIPFKIWREFREVREVKYERGFIVLVPPQVYFDELNKDLSAHGLKLGENALLYYTMRREWQQYNPSDYGLCAAKNRTGDLGGQYVARIANTPSKDAERINHGYVTKGTKGAGIRQYEYAPSKTIKDCKEQLEAIFWHCEDAIEAVTAGGMDPSAARARKEYALEVADRKGLLDTKRLVQQRILSEGGYTTCPLCLEHLSAKGFLSRMEQAPGREKHDLTVTEINLFHIEELNFPKLNHSPYNLGWGHHHCNVVCKDSGIFETLAWMQTVLTRNKMA